MAAFTLCTDESGQFVAKDGVLGKHVTVAVVLPGRGAALDGHVHGALERALAPFPLPFHASDWTHARNIGKHLQGCLDAVSGVSAELRATLESGILPHPRWRLDPARLHLLREVDALGARQLLAAGRAVRGLLDDGGLAVACLAHGPWEGGRDGWTPMIVAVITHALLEIARRPGGPHEVHLRVGQTGSHARQVDLEPALRALAAARAAGAPLAEVRAAKWVAAEAKKTDPLLQAADVIAHAIGPGRWALREVSLAEARSLGLSRLRSSTPVGEHLLAGGARPETLGELEGALDDWHRHASADITLRDGRLRDRLEKLPPQTFRCAVEGTRLTLAGLRGDG